MLIAQILLLVWPFFRLGIGIREAALTEGRDDLVASIIAKFVSLFTFIGVVYLAGGYSRMGL